MPADSFSALRTSYSLRARRWSAICFPDELKSVVAVGSVNDLTNNTQTPLSPATGLESCPALSPKAVPTNLGSLPNPGTKGLLKETLSASIAAVFSLEAISSIDLAPVAFIFSISISPFFCLRASTVTCSRTASKGRIPFSRISVSLAITNLSPKVNTLEMSLILA